MLVASPLLRGPRRSRPREDKRRLPNFCIAGVPKAGTSSLYQYLRAHPDVFLPDQKELHFFTAPHLLCNIYGPGDKEAVATVCRTIDSYVDHYRRGGNELAVGDASPSYFYFSDCLSDIAQVLGNDVKMIVLLRDPISRSFSNYMHMVLTGRETLDFYSALLEEPKRAANGWGDFWRYQDHSLYCSRLEALTESFVPENIHIVLAEELLANRVATFCGVLRFLGVHTNTEPPNLNVEYNRSADLASQRTTSRFLQWTRTAASALPRKQRQRLSLIYDRRRARGTDAKHCPIDPRAVDYLLTRFAPDVQRLRQQLGKPLAVWRCYN